MDRAGGRADYLPHETPLTQTTTRKKNEDSRARCVFCAVRVTRSDRPLMDAQRRVTASQMCRRAHRASVEMRYATLFFNRVRLTLAKLFPVGNHNIHAKCVRRLATIRVPRSTWTSFRRATPETRWAWKWRRLTSPISRGTLYLPVVARRHGHKRNVGLRTATLCTLATAGSQSARRQPDGIAVGTVEHEPSLYEPSSKSVLSIVA